MTILFAGIIAIVYAAAILVGCALLFLCALNCFASAIVGLVAAPFRAKLKAVAVPPEPLRANGAIVIEGPPVIYSVENPLARTGFDYPHAIPQPDPWIHVEPEPTDDGRTVVVPDPSVPWKIASTPPPAHITRYN